MDVNNDMYSFNHTANAERVINSQIEDLKTEISYLIFEMENISYGHNEIDFTEDRIADLNYQINKLTTQLERLSKEWIDY